MPILTETDKAVLKTIIYFDLFEYPLTCWEIYKNLISKNQTSFQLVKNSLNNVKTFIANNEGFYFLVGKQNLIAKRKSKYLTAQKKFTIARKNARLLSKLPFVKAIFVCNSLAYSNAKDKSDIDFAIITKANRLWSARFFCALIMKFLGRRPTELITKNKICLSFFVDENYLNLLPYAYQNDLHFIYWIKQFFPIYDPLTLNKQLQKENSWTKKYLTNYFYNLANENRSINSRTCLAKFFESIASIFPEKSFKKIQQKFLAAKIKKQSADDSTNVVLNNRILKLHTKDKRQHFNDLWRLNCQQYIPRQQLTDIAKLIINNW